MKKINYKSDFDVLVSFNGQDGLPTDILDLDFVGKVYTGLSPVPYPISHHGEEWENCHAEGDKLHIVIDNHGLERGELVLDLALDIPNSHYPDQIRTVVNKYPLGIQLVSQATEAPSSADVDFLAPYITINIGALDGVKEAIAECRVVSAETRALKDEITEAILHSHTKAEEAAKASDKAEASAATADVATANALDATESATQATERANLSASKADVSAEETSNATNACRVMIQAADVATDNATIATNNAISATTSAQQAVQRVESIIGDAESAVSNANNAATNANMATLAANNAADRVDGIENAVNEATSNANTSAERCESATLSAQQATAEVLSAAEQQAAVIGDLSDLLDAINNEIV